MTSNRKSLLERQFKNTIKKIVKEMLKEGPEESKKESVPKKIPEIKEEIVTAITGNEGFETTYIVLFQNLINLRNLLNKKIVEFDQKEEASRTERQERARKGQFSQEDKDLFEQSDETLKFRAEVNNLIDVVSEYEVQSIKSAVKKFENLVEIALERYNSIPEYMFRSGPDTLFTIVRLFFAQKKGYDEGGRVAKAIKEFEDAKQKFDVVAKKFPSEFYNYINTFLDPENENSIKNLVERIRLRLKTITSNFTLLNKQSEKIKTELSADWDKPLMSASERRDFGRYYRFHENKSLILRKLLRML